MASVSACTPDSRAGDDLAEEGLSLDGTSDGDDDDDDDDESSTDGETTSDDTSGDGDGEGDGDGDGESDDGPETKWDLNPWTDGIGGEFCTVPPHNPCDDEDSDPWHAIGINCPGGYALTTQYTGDPSAIYVHTAPLGTYMPATYPALEGEKIVIMASGTASEMASVGDSFASTALAGNDPGPNLPPPIVTNAVGGDCTMNPGLVGTGDCSGTIIAQWMQGSGAYDYAEMRISGEVPSGASGFGYNLAFFSTEYPAYYQTTFNDMYIAWLQSELWTGNVSFDELGSPISLNAGFLDYKDAPNPYDCPAPCTAPELQGTVMQTHAGTKWLTTTAGVVPGEDFILVFAIFDLTDNILDSVVILDNFQWNCEGGPPVTIPS